MTQSRLPVDARFGFFSRDSYDNAAFLFVSDDMDWGRKNLKDKNHDLVKEVFLHSSHLSLRSPDVAARIIRYNFYYYYFYTVAPGFEPMSVTRVAPD